MMFGQLHMHVRTRQRSACCFRQKCGLAPSRSSDGDPYETSVCYPHGNTGHPDNTDHGPRGQKWMRSHKNRISFACAGGHYGCQRVRTTADYDGDGTVEAYYWWALQQKFKDGASLQAWFADNCENATVTGDLVEQFMFFNDAIDYYEEFSDYSGSAAGGAGIAPGLPPMSAPNLGPSRRLRNVDSNIPASLSTCRDNSGLMEEFVECDSRTTVSCK